MAITDTDHVLIVLTDYRKRTDAANAATLRVASQWAEDNLSDRDIRIEHVEARRADGARHIETIDRMIERRVAGQPLIAS